MSVSALSSWEAAVRRLLDDPSQADLVRACYFDRPAIDAATRFHQSEEWVAVRQYFPTVVGKALDLGAGMGISSFALGKDGWNVVALEPDPSSLVGAAAIRKLAETAGLKIDVVEKTGERLPFASESFDLVFARQALHHAADLRKVCNEAFRVLKPGGCFVAAREHVVSGPAQLRHFLANHPLHRYYGGENAFTLRSYTTALQGAGFSLKAVLGPWDSSINYFPHTRESLRNLLLEKAGIIPGVRLLAQHLFSEQHFAAVLMLLRFFDRRPGRLYTFVCQKDYDCS